MMIYKKKKVLAGYSLTLPAGERGDALFFQTYLVVDVGNVHDKVDIVTKVVHENAPDDIGRDVVSGVA